VRRFVGDTGHSPIGGIAVSALTPRDYVGAILAILASLWGGIVLGPEVALVATGSMVGTVTAKGMRITDPATQTKVVGFGALGAILALLVGPILSGSFQLGSTPTSHRARPAGLGHPHRDHRECRRHALAPARRGARPSRGARTPSAQSSSRPR